MSWIPSEIESYCVNHSTTPSDIAGQLQQYTMSSVHGSQMLIGKMESSVLTFLIKLGNVKNILEFGTYTGYSALVMAEQLPLDGKVTTIDVNRETCKIARRYWDMSPHGKKIHQIIDPGLEAMATIEEMFDLIFIDADKNNYSNYLVWSLQHLNPSGLIVVDNTLWGGKVLRPGLDKQTESIREHNQKVNELVGYTKVLLPVRDGMYLIKKN